MKHLLTFSLFAILQLGWAQSEYCLDGTVWDATLGGCVPEVNQCDLQYDFNGDGIVGAGDLLMFLTGYGATFVDADSDGICDDNDDCSGVVDECGICNGPGAIYECGCFEIPEADCDCEGNQEDALGICGGGCVEDADFDGVCDDLDPCVGALDECGICNGPGAIYECGCDEGDALGNCGGNCLADFDEDGICDDTDDCVGSIDECGLCNGPGAVYDCGCEECSEFVQCGDPIGYQGYNYNTVLIGDQCWFAENLRSLNYRNGDAIIGNLSTVGWAAASFGAVSIYGEEPSDGCTENAPNGNACDAAWSLEQYGALYNGYAINDPRQICPAGWHVSSVEDWGVLSDYFGGNFPAGGNLKSTYGWFLGGNGADAVGFSGLPGGMRATWDWVQDGEQFVEAGEQGYWWARDTTSVQDLTRQLRYDVGYLIATPNPTGIKTGCSVRCIQDAE